MTTLDASALNPFENLAAAYEGWFATPIGSFVARREEDLILRFLGPRPGEIILEVGSGTDYFLRMVARSGARCIGIEPAVEMLSVALAQSAGSIDHVRGVGEALPFQAESFDGLLYMTTLEFVQDVAAAIEEAMRVVRPGGRLVFGVLNADGPWARARRREGGLWDEAHFYRTQELKALLSPLGPVQFDYGVHVPPQLGWLPAPFMNLLDRLLRLIIPAGGALIGVRVAKGGPS